MGRSSGLRLRSGISSRKEASSRLSKVKHFMLFSADCLLKFFERPLSFICILCVPYVPRLLRHALQLTLSPNLAWATRALIVRKLKGLEALIRKLLNYSIYNGTLICFEYPAVT